MILAILSLPIVLLILSIGVSTFLYLLVIAIIVRYAVTLAYSDCLLSWKLLMEWDTYDLEHMSPSMISANKNAILPTQRRRRMSLSPPIPALETIAEQDGCISLAPVDGVTNIKSRFCCRNTGNNFATHESLSRSAINGTTKRSVTFAGCVVFD